MSRNVGLALSLSTLLACANDPSTNSIVNGSVPTSTVSGNPSCEDLGLGDTELRINAPEQGEHVYALGSAGSVTVIIDDEMLDWSATMGIDGVIMKGGTQSNVYVYDPEALADTGLH